jgi:putative toxin-antitoxin system antitoxin component (TIGR02293 family)
MAHSILAAMTSSVLHLASQSVGKQPDPGVVITQALIKAASLWNLGQGQLGAIIGMSPSSVSRLNTGKLKLEPGSKPYQLATLMLRAWRSLDAIVGSSDEAARTWLTSPNKGLDGARPLDLLSTPQGLVKVCDYLDSRRGLL